MCTDKANIHEFGSEFYCRHQTVFISFNIKDIPLIIYVIYGYTILSGLARYPDAWSRIFSKWISRSLSWYKCNNYNIYNKIIYLIITLFAYALRKDGYSQIKKQGREGP